MFQDHQNIRVKFLVAGVMCVTAGLIGLQQSSQPDTALNISAPYPETAPKEQPLFAAHLTAHMTANKSNHSHEFNDDDTLDQPSLLMFTVPKTKPLDSISMQSDDGVHFIPFPRDHIGAYRVKKTLDSTGRVAFEFTHDEPHQSVGLASIDSSHHHH